MHHLRRVIGTVIGLVLVVAPALAHQPLFPLKPGQLDLSLNTQLNDGVIQFSTLYVDQGIVTQAVKRFIWETPNGEYAPINTFAEIGILPGWSIGLNTNFPGGLVNLINGAEFGDIGLGLYSTLHLVDAGWYRLYLHGLAEATPIYSATTKNPTMELFALVSQGFRVLDLPEGGLWGYLDLKAHTLLINTLLIDEATFIKNTLGRSGDPHALDGVLLSCRPIYKLYLATGFDFKIDFFLINVGWNIPIVYFTAEDGLLDLGPAVLINPINLELSVRFRI